MSEPDTSQVPQQDPYTVRAGEAKTPPTRFLGRLRHLGPSIIISGSVVGSGEIILTASLGAAVGFTLFWWVLLSCWIKSLTQAEIARYIITSGDTYLRAINRLPGKLPGPNGPIAWPLALAVVAQIPAIMGLGGIVGGAGQSVHLLVPSVSAVAATGGIAALSVALLLSGSYKFLERAMLVLVLSFAFTTLVCSILMQFTEYAITPADLAHGLSFEFPAAYVVLALSVYGYTGVNSAELPPYTFWCIEKGYPSFIGPSDAPGFAARARGWIRVVQTDVLATLLILTCATVPFYMLGAGVLNAMGKRPQGSETISALSSMFTETLGPWSLWLFGIGAFSILFSTTVAGIAGGSRYFADLVIALGFVDRQRIDIRTKIIRGWCILAPIVAFGFYRWFQNPIFLVTVGAVTAAIFLPIQTGAVLWLHKNRLDPRVRPGQLVRFALWGIFLFQVAMSVLVIWYVVL